MADMITRCPKCETAFRISEAHLASAKGAVRCGSCLNIFNAKENLASNTEDKPKTEEDKAAHQPEPLEEEHDDDTLISDDMTPIGPETTEFQITSADLDDNILYSNHLGQQESNLFERPMDDDRDSDESPQTDESWAVNLLEEDDDDEEQFNTEDRAPLSETGEHFEEEYRRPLFNTWKSNTQELNEALNEFEESSARHYEQASTTDYIDAIEPEPVEFDWKVEQPLWETRLFWGSLSVLALILLILQISWLQFHSLNKKEPFRSYYAVACKVVGCKLPPLVDLAKIRTSNLVVRSHPKVKQALMVDVVLQNIASFQQPFPVLELSFRDLNGRVVANRRFSPGDYLAGEMAGRTKIPIKQPVHIGLEIADPGTQAVSYNMTISR